MQKSLNTLENNLTAQEQELGEYLNNTGEIDFPGALPPHLKKLYDASKDHEEKFIVILNDLGQEAVAQAMRITNEALKKK